MFSETFAYFLSVMTKHHEFMKLSLDVRRSVDTKVYMRIEEKISPCSSSTPVS